MLTFRIREPLNKISDCQNEWINVLISLISTTAQQMLQNTKNQISGAITVVAGLPI